MKNPAAEISRVLASVLEMEKEFSAFVRRTAWGDGPVYFVGSQTSYPACLTAAAAFEAHLGVPAMARVEAEFLAYSLDALRPRALVFVIPPLEDGEAMRSAHRALKAKGARLLTLSGQPDNPLASLAEGVVPFAGLPEGSSSFSSLLARHATLACLALVARRVLKPPSEGRRREEAEFEKLPEEAERTVVRWSDALQVFGDEVKGASRLLVAGGGRFFPVALEIARQLEKASGVEVLAQNVSQAGPPPLQPDERAIVLSCSRCRVNAQVDPWAAEVRNSGAAVIALTDAVDQGLLDQSRLSFLLPAFGETAASILQFAVSGAWVPALARGRARPK
jgi:fructoselysine-6-P-deglycase FrlB-like protein